MKRPENSAAKSPLLRRTRLSAVVLSTALALAACSSSSDVDQGTKDSSTGGLSKAEMYTTGVVGVEGDPGEPVKGGLLTVADFGEPRSLDPAVTYANGATGGSALAALYDTLVRYDYESKSYEPQLAESLESPDNVTWTLKLREGVTFSDGTPLNADAVMGSIGRYQKMFGYNALPMITNVAGMKKTDERTITWTLRTPWADFPNMLAGGAGMIVAPAAYKDPKAFKPVGAGAFVFAKYAPGEELKLTANAKYHDGAPNLDGLRFIWLGAVDDQPKLDAVKSGDADTAFLRSAPIVEKARDEKLAGMMYAGGLGSNLWINNRKGRPGEDVRVRQAINYAIDAEAHNTRAYEGAGLPTKSLWPESSPWHTDVEEAKADPAKAKALLKEAKADGYDGKITYLHGADATSSAAAVNFKAMLEAAGFTVKLEALRSVADQVQRLYVDHDYDLAIGATTVPEVDPYTRLFGQLNAKSPINTSGYANPEMDKALVELQAAGTPEDGAAAMTKIEELWSTEVPGVGLRADGTFLAWDKDVHGVTPTVETMVLYDDAWKS